MTYSLCDVFLSVQHGFCNAGPTSQLTSETGKGIYDPTFGQFSVRTDSGSFPSSQSVFQVF